MNKGIAEHTARFDIAALRTFGRSAPPPEGVITPMLLKAADDMEKMLEDAAVLEEREACAQIADAHASIEGIAQRIAAEIRGRQR